MVGADDLTLLDFAFSMCFSTALVQHYWLYIACLSTKVCTLLCRELEPHKKFLLFHHFPAVKKHPGKDPSSLQHLIFTSGPAQFGFLLFIFLCAVY